MVRTKLPHRRLAINKRVLHRLSSGKEQSLTVTYGVVNGKVAEIFCASFKAGTDLESVVVDASILLSRLLQHGDDIISICESLSKPHSLIGSIASRATTLQREIDLRKEKP